ncbi:MAG: FAD-dependent oxidoreductase [Desulfobacterales bacterium]|nr:FAD-dependent oxidoreductase [Desulfobacterales bacterium]
MGMDRNERIGIVGAGAAGLSLARRLADSGFRSVTVLERESEPGGSAGLSGPRAETGSSAP